MPNNFQLFERVKKKKILSRKNILKTIKYQQIEKSFKSSVTQIVCDNSWACELRLFSSKLVNYASFIFSDQL